MIGRSAFLATAFLAVGSVAAAANDTVGETISLDYEAYFGGFHIVSARTEIRTTGDAYEIFSQARSRGLFEWLSNWRGTAESRGRITDDGRVYPIRHDNGGQWDDNQRQAALIYQPNGDIIVERDDGDESDRDPVTPIPEGSTLGTVDPISAIMALAQAIQMGGSCDATIPVYDGRRRYDVLVEARETEVFEPNDYSIFAGEAQACEVSLDRIGGFRVERSKYQETARDRKVWVASPIEGAQPLPVRVDVETDFGDLVIHLTAARFGDTEIAVSPGLDNMAD